MHELEKYVVTIPDFPEPGIMFRDVTSVLADAKGLKLSVDEMLALLDGTEFDVIAGLESRGFLFGMPMAYEKNCPFVLIRKKGKLPRKTVEESYALEYGTAVIEVHEEDIKPGMRVVLVDDLLATGGTLEAAAKLVEKLGASVAKIVALIELKGLNGRDRLAGYDFASVIQYEGK